MAGPYLADGVLVKIFSNKSLHQLQTEREREAHKEQTVKYGSRSAPRFCHHGYLQSGGETVWFQVLVFHAPGTVDHHIEMTHLVQRHPKMTKDVPATR